MMNRRGFLKALSAFGAGLLIDPAAELLVPERKIWVVGADFKTRVARERSPMIVEIPAAYLEDPVKEAILSEYLKTPDGCMALAAAMAHPIRKQLDYTSIARNVFRVETLPDGALPYYRGS